MRIPRRNHTAALKADEALAALAEKFDVHPIQITQWKSQLLENALGVFLTVAARCLGGNPPRNRTAPPWRSSMQPSLLHGGD